MTVLEGYPFRFIHCHLSLLSLAGIPPEKAEWYDFLPICQRIRLSPCPLPHAMSPTLLARGLFHSYGRLHNSSSTPPSQSREVRAPASLLHQELCTDINDDFPPMWVFGVYDLSACSGQN